MCGAALGPWCPVSQGPSPSNLSPSSCALSNLKKVSLELGGKSPLIIFADCDLSKAVQMVRPTGLGQHMAFPDSTAHTA